MFDMPVRSVIGCVPHHWVLCALCSWALAIISFKSTCYKENVDIVNLYTENKTKPTVGCPFLFAGSSWEKKELPFHIPDIFWDPKSLVIGGSAFYSGMLLMGVPAGLLSDIGYSKYVLTGGVLLLTGHYLLLTTLVEYGFKAYMALCFIEGIGEASIYPSIYALISRYSSPSKRNTFTALVVAGSYYGTIVGHVFYNFVNVRFRSWSFGKHSIGVVGVVWLACWSIYGHLFSPHESPLIPQQLFRTTSISRRRRYLLFAVQKLKLIPWRQIVCSKPFLSLILVYCSLDWAAYLNVWGTLVPYQEHILHLPADFTNYSNIMVISVLPMSLLGAFFADWVITHDLTSRTVIKRTFAFISVFCSSVLQVTLPLVGCNVILFWVLAITAMYIVGLAVPVILSNPIDLSPRHTGLLMGIMTTADTICFLFDLKIGETLVPNKHNQNYWRNKFFVFALLATAMMIPFLFFGSGETQLWNRTNTRLFRRNSPPSIISDTSGGLRMNPPS